MLTQAIENLLNRNLPRSPRARELCESLAGKRVRIEARGLGWVLDRRVAEHLDPAHQGAPPTGNRRMRRSPAAC